MTKAFAPGVATPGANACVSDPRSLVHGPVNKQFRGVKIKEDSSCGSLCCPDAIPLALAMTSIGLVRSAARYGDAAAGWSRLTRHIHGALTVNRRGSTALSECKGHSSQASLAGPLRAC